MSSTSGRWKKALLPSLGNFRRGHSATGHLPASRTVSGIGVEATNMQKHNGLSHDSTNDDVDDRVISVLLDTSGEVEEDKQFAIARQTRGIAHSRTAGAMPSKVNSPIAHSPAKTRSRISKHPTPPRRSSKRCIQTVTLDFSRPSPKRSADGLVRPLPRYRSSNILGRETRRIIQSPSKSPARLKRHHWANGTAWKGDSDAEKTSSPLTLALTVPNDLNESITNSADSTAPSRMSRIRKNKVFAKFAGAFSEHFGKQAARKDEKYGDSYTGCISMATNETVKPITHGLPLGRLTLAQLPLLEIELSAKYPEQRFNEDISSKDREGNTIEARVSEGRSVPQKRLGIVEGSPTMEDPFSDESSGQHPTEFEARLKTAQAFGPGRGHGPVTPLTDPFLAEGIMDTSANSILKTPPIGSSTPRVRVRSLIPIRINTSSTLVFPDASIEMVMTSPDGPLTSPSKRRKVTILCESPTKISSSPDSVRKEANSGDSSSSPSKAQEACDSTRLSSFPPGSTIRRVPRSMGRLTGVPEMSMTAATRRKSPKIGRKKHPSPSKRDLDVYGKFMEKNVSLGVFKDVDELAMNPNSLLFASSPALTPRDKNILIRGSTSSQVDLRKDRSSKECDSILVPRSRSRIPQPVSHLTRSRTGPAFARDFLPPNHGDSPTEDELQWDSTSYIVGRGRGSRCNHCGSVSEAV